MKRIAWPGIVVVAAYVAAWVQAGWLDSNETKSVNWSDMTFNIDALAYGRLNRMPVDIPLMDFTGNDAVFDGTFKPTVNITGHPCASLSFDTAQDRLVLTVEPVGTVVKIR